jgi:general stress protein 26
MEHSPDTRSAALAFLTENDLAALSTVSSEGGPRSRLVYYAADDAFSVYFLSLANTRKVADIRANPKAAFVVMSDDKHRTLQIEGSFEEITDTATFGPILSELTKHLFPKGEESAPVAHLDEARPVFFKLVPSWVRFGDFTLAKGSSDAFAEINP